MIDCLGCNLIELDAVELPDGRYLCRECPELPQNRRQDAPERDLSDSARQD